MEVANNQKNNLNAGYLLIPRRLLNRVIIQNKTKMSEEQAFLSMLSLVNYKSAETQQGHCDRGESLLRLSEWSKIFGWHEWKTRRFFKKLEQTGEICINKKRNPHTIRIVNYEELCANKKTAGGKTPENQNDKRFEEFWQTFHQITQQMPQEAELARRQWNKLSLREQEMATNHIGEYFMSLNNVKHVRKAVNYLKCHSFQF